MQHFFNKNSNSCFLWSFKCQKKPMFTLNAPLTHFKHSWVETFPGKLLRSLHLNDVLVHKNISETYMTLQIHVAELCVLFIRTASVTINHRRGFFFPKKQELWYSRDLVADHVFKIPFHKNQLSNIVNMSICFFLFDKSEYNEWNKQSTQCLYSINLADRFRQPGFYVS